MTDWETRYYEAEALHTEANGMLTAERDRMRKERDLAKAQLENGPNSVGFGLVMQVVEAEEQRDALRAYAVTAHELLREVLVQSREHIPLYLVSEINDALAKSPIDPPSAMHARGSGVAADGRPSVVSEGSIPSGSANFVHETVRDINKSLTCAHGRMYYEVCEACLPAKGSDSLHQS